MANNIEKRLQALTYIDGSGVARQGVLVLGSNDGTPKLLALDANGALTTTTATDDPSIGTVGDTADIGGTIHAQLSYIGDQVDNAYDEGTDSKLVNVLNPVWNRYTDAESLVSASDIGASDDTWVDQGSEIDCRGYKTLAIFVVLTVNDSTGNQLQILPKIELAGSDEYTLETSADYQKTIGDSDLKVVYTFNVEGIPFVQLQTKATDVDTGGGVEGTVSIDIVKEY